ncbi:MAG: S26 family signal peptidase [Candidatus Omnitrophota bacterium]|nr:S26 family signal peptidase [Candidatus Omnitrophota bacterium]
MDARELVLSDNALRELLEATIPRGRPLRFQANGFSMTPFIRDNDIITIAPLSRSRNLLGMPVAFVQPKTKKLVVHRIISCSGGRYGAKGDNSWGGDGLLRRADIIGVVSAVERNGRRLLLGLGPERILIAWLSRFHLLRLCMRALKILKQKPRNYLPD